MPPGENRASSGSFDESQNLGPAEKDQAAQHSAPAAVVIHEIVRKDGEEELARRPGAVFWSGLAAGLSMGFSFLALALIRSGLPDDPARRLLEAPGYAVGFVTDFAEKPGRESLGSGIVPSRAPRSGFCAACSHGARTKE